MPPWSQRLRHIEEQQKYPSRFISGISRLTDRKRAAEKIGTPLACLGHRPKVDLAQALMRRLYDSAHKEVLPAIYETVTTARVINGWAGSFG